MSRRSRFPPHCPLGEYQVLSRPSTAHPSALPTQFIADIRYTLEAVEGKFEGLAMDNFNFLPVWREDIKNIKHMLRYSGRSRPHVNIAAS